jgi:integrase
MTTQQHALTRASGDASALAGADVCAAAGFRVRPGGRPVMFDDDTWRFDDIDGLSVQMGGRSSTRLDFTAISDPRWRLAAKEYLFARLAPAHPVIAVLPRAFRVPLALTSCLKRLAEATRWLNWLAGQRVPSLAAVTQEHCDRYLAERRLRRDAGGAVIGTFEESVVRVAAAAVTELASYGDLLSADRYPDGFTPWNGKSTAQVAGMRPPAENKTPVVPQEVLQPLLAAALYVTAAIAPHLVTLSPQVRQRQQEMAQLGEAAPDLGMVKDALRRHVRDGEPLEAVRDVDVRTRLQQGWSADDPLLSVSFTALAREAGTARIRPPVLADVRPLAEQAVAAVGTAKPWGRQAEHVPLAGGTGTAPWTLPLDERDIRDLVGYAHTACLVLAAALTGMRGSELMELRHGCRSTSEHGDGMTRYRLKSKLIKGQPLGGISEEWVVVKAVYDTIGMAEQLSLITSRIVGDPGDLIFGRFNFNSRYPWLRDWVNGPAGQRLGLAPIPDGDVTPRMLRRTLARELAYRPGGLLAAKLHLKHISVATTEGYAARPGGAQGRLLAEIAEDEADRNLQIVLEEYRNYQDGIMPAGPGARELTAFFASIDTGLAGHEAGAPRVVASDQHVLNLLTKRAQVLHLAAANYCWFTDPSRALCLKMAGTPAADKPLAGMCDSARCPQATHHPCHRPVWADAVASTTAFIGSLGRTRTAERTRLQAELDRARHVLDSIDAATAKEDEHADHR